jgi:hypothetical protein
MTRSETPHHRKLKEIIRVSFSPVGAVLTEYPSSGRRLDTLIVTPDGISVYVEIIWSNSWKHFLNDLNSLLESDADIKAVVASPSVIANAQYEREFLKTVIAQRRLGKFVLDHFVNGEAILENPSLLPSSLLAPIQQLVELSREDKRLDSIRQMVTDRKAIHLRGDAYYRAVDRCVESGPKLFRAIVVGPHFLHPNWVMRRRIARNPRPSFSYILRNYLEDTIRQAKPRDIRLIIRNNPRYRAILSELVEPNEISRLTEDMCATLHRLFESERSQSALSFCCIDLGFYHGVIIGDSTCLVSNRPSGTSQITDGYVLSDPDNRFREFQRFEETFNANFKGQDAEIKMLERYMSTLVSDFQSLSSSSGIYRK